MPSPLCPVGGTSLGSDRGVGGGASACTPAPPRRRSPVGPGQPAGPAGLPWRRARGRVLPVMTTQPRALRRGPDSRASPHLADLGAEAPAGQGSPGRRHCSARGARLWGRVCRGHSPPATVRGPVLRPPRGGDAVGSDCGHGGRPAGRRHRVDAARWPGSPACSRSPGPQPQSRAHRGTRSAPSRLSPSGHECRRGLGSQRVLCLH